MPPAPALKPETRTAAIPSASAEVAPRKRNLSMSKDRSKGNKEAKKPKKEAPKVLATANSGLGKDGMVIAGKKVK
jgi:hypothetical protein